MDDLAIKAILILFTAGCTVVGGLLLWGLKSLISAVYKNTHEMAILNSKIQDIVTKTDKISKLQEDVNGLYTWKKKFQESESSN